MRSASYSIIFVGAAVIVVAACAQIQGIDGYEKVDCLDNCPGTDTTPDSGAIEGSVDPCTNGAKDVGEIDIDCGGTCAKKCSLGQACVKPEDCEGAPETLCLKSTCSVKGCTDGAKSGTESDLDCGGGQCPKCEDGKACVVDTDCLSGACNTPVCVVKPALISITPPSGPTAGGTKVTFTGTSFVDRPGWSARFGTTNSGGVFVSPTELYAFAPAASFSTVDVSIVGMPGGTMTRPMAFTYIDTSIPLADAVLFGYTGASAVAVGDHNGDGKPEFIQDHVQSHMDGFTNNTTLPTMLTFGGVAVTSAAPYAPPRRALIVDVDGDNKGDIVETDFPTATVLTGNIGVRISTGTGFVAPVVYPTSSLSPEGLVVVDFNGDNRADVALIHSAADILNIMINSGTGTFPTATPIVVPGGTRIATADLNGDGKRDLVVSAAAANQVTLLLGNGNGTFAPPVALPTSSPTAGVAIGDVDFDGKLDIVAGATTGGKLIFLGGNGNGTFKAAIDTVVPVAVSIPQLVVTDFNGDNRADVAFLDPTQGQCAVWVSPGNGTFVASNKIYAVPLPTDLAIADFNGDGKIDLFYAGGGTSQGIRIHLRQ